MELEPCPFCGSRSVYVEQIGSGGYFNVCCCNCLASVPLSGSRETAVSVWNRRAVDVEALREVVDELECAYRPEDYASVDALCELSNAASKAVAKRIREAVGL
mgnify:CR=1 FL=1